MLKAIRLMLNSNRVLLYVKMGITADSVNSKNRWFMKIIDIMEGR